MATEKLKIYGDRRSQPTRATFIFCKVNGIEFEEVETKLFSADIENPEFQAANPLKKVPAIAHGDFTLFERYPNDLRKRAKVQCVLDWHHTSLRLASTRYMINTVLAPALGKAPNLEAAAEYGQMLMKSFSTIESLWLQGDSKFLLGNDEPSLADLALVCEIMQLQIIPKEERNKMIGPFKKVQQWVENVKEATNPHFDEVHQFLLDSITDFQQTA
ncbi:Glutathione S-transferase T1 [Bienertia sinuspersici]